MNDDSRVLLAKNLKNIKLFCFIERSISNFLPNNAVLNGLYPIVVSKSFDITTRHTIYSNRDSSCQYRLKM